MDFWKKHGSIISAGILIALIFFSLGVKSGKNSLESNSSLLSNRTEGEPSEVDFSAFWKAWNALEEKYVPASTTAKTISTEEKVWGAIKGLADSFNDPYTVFFPPVESAIFEADIRGNFEGVGMEILAQEGAITVISPLRGSPAERAGILAGDRITRIDGKETSGLSTDEAVRMIRGPKGTAVKLTIFRNGRKEPLEIPVIREVINIPTGDTRLLENGIFVIELYNFSAQSPNFFRQALREFVISGSDKLLLDLRGNPGGYLEASIDMASWFLPPGKVVVRESFGEGKEEKIYRSKGYNIFTDNLKFVILVDGGSASASEILAGALSEHGVATIVGSQTFGKGSVQELVSITPETSLKITIARWLTPKGASISDNGVVPDVEVRRTVLEKEAGEDPQLERAIEILMSR